MKKSKSSRDEKKTNGVEIPPPFNQIYTGRDEEADRLVTALFLTAEALSAPLLPQHDRPPIPHAVPEGYDFTAIPQDFTGLLRVIGQMQALLEQDPRLTGLLAKLPEAFGSPEALGMLYRNLFPGQKNWKLMDENGKPLLTPREVEVLREASRDLTHEEIAEKLSISPRTVEKHLTNIYTRLGVKKPIQAVARAIATGYLEMDAMEVIYEASRCWMRNFEVFHTFLGGPVSGGVARNPALKSLAEFGLLMLVLSRTAVGSLGCYFTDPNGKTGPGLYSISFRAGTVAQPIISTILSR